MTVGLFVMLIFNAGRVVDALKLDHEFANETFNLGTLTEESIVKISSIIVGGITIINHLPNLMSQTLFAIRADNIVIDYTANDKFYWFASFLQVSVGFFLVFYHKQVELLLLKKGTSNLNSINDD